MRLFDAHCHPQFEQYNDDRQAVIQRALDAGVGLVAVGTSMADSFEAVKLAEQYPDQPVYAAVGVHPTDDDLEGVSMEEIKSLLSGHKVVAIGETGLDWYRIDDPDVRQLQSDIFEQHLLSASEKRLPVIVHTRDRPGSHDAYEVTHRLLIRHQFHNFVMHCYGSDWTHAQKFLDLGGFISFDGNITYPKSAMALEVIKNMPLNRLLVETDAPFLAPVPHRGKRNEPAWVELVAKKIAEVRGVDLDEVARMTTENARKFYNLH